MEVTVRSEPRVYSERGEHSYFADLGVSELGPTLPSFYAATERLQRHAEEVEAEIRSGSPEGRSAERRMRESARESRTAMSSGAASGGAFVTPEYLTSLFAVYRSAPKSFTNQCTNLPLPEYGMTINVPSFASSSLVAQPTPENSGASHLDPTGTDLSVSLTTLTGQINVSQQLFDRGGFTGAGGTFDAIAIKQMASQLNAAIDAYVLTQAITSAGTVTDNSTLTITKFFSDMSTARELLTDTAGTRISGTHLFSTSDFAGWITKQVDSQGRPIFLPDAGALFEADHNPEWQGWLGLCMPGGLQWFADDNIPASSGNTQVIVTNPTQILVWSGDPVTFAYPETNATNLSVLIGLKCYVGALPVYPKAVAVISGTAYPTSLV